MINKPLFSLSFSSSKPLFLETASSERTLTTKSRQLASTLTAIKSLQKKTEELQREIGEQKRMQEGVVGAV